VTTLFEVMGLKQLCKQAGVAKIDVGDRGMTLAFFQNTFAAPTKLITYVLEKKGVITVRPDQSLVIKADIRDPKAKLKLAHKVLRDLVGLLPAKEDA
jgi:transcription-repair coupling factor (superfamily II helicase)